VKEDKVVEVFIDFRQKYDRESHGFIDSFCPKKAKLLLIVGKIKSN
jgi:Ni,Fe-hydrogenase III small subunit